MQYINRTYQRSGTLCEGRFRSCACYRYIELNPVRAGMVMRPRDYRWTSYHANGLWKASALFKAHVEPERVDEIRDVTNGNFALGSKRFQQQIESALGSRAIRGVSGRPTKQVQSNDRQKELL